jgi:hypothetical protein
MTSFREQASWIKMRPPGGNSAMPCHLTKKVNKAEELNYLSMNIG